MRRVKPALRVRELKSSPVFYSRSGLVLDWAHPFKPGLPIFASLSHDGMDTFRTGHAGDCAFGTLVLFYVADADSCHRRLIDAGVPVAPPPLNALGSTIRDMLATNHDEPGFVYRHAG